MQDRYKAVNHAVSAEVVQVVIVALVAEAVPLKQWSEYGMCHAAACAERTHFGGCDLLNSLSLMLTTPLLMCACE